MTPDEYWNVVVGEKRTAKDVVQEFEIRSAWDAFAWLGKAERTAANAGADLYKLDPNGAFFNAAHDAIIAALVKGDC